MFCVAVKQGWAIDFNKLNSVLLSINLISL